jgi:7-cyano-7-deazaguanine synthase
MAMHSDVAGERRWDDLIACRSAVAVVSGGMDSVTLAYLLKSRAVELLTLSVDYGQRHRRELAYARAAAGRLGVARVQIDMPGRGGQLDRSALTDDRVAVPDGHYTDGSMRTTVVPNRNANLLALATAIAVARGVEAVAFAAHSGDHAIYSGCRDGFVDAFATMARVSNEGFVRPDFQVVAPFVHLTKADIVAVGTGLGLPYEQTRSCYRRGSIHCGRCGTCTERREAFVLAGVPDPTAYADGA